MSIKAKLTVSLLAVVLVFCGALGPVLQRVISPSFEQLELEEAREDADRVVAALETEIDALDLVAEDWGVWDDCHDYVSGVKPEFAQENVYDGLEESLDIVLFQISDLDGKVLLDFRKPHEEHDGVELTALPSDQLPRNSPLRRPLETLQSAKGLLRTEWGLLLIVTQPVLRNERVGPVAGVLIMARLVDAARVEEYRAKTHVFFQLHEPQPQWLADLDDTTGPGSTEASAPVFTTSTQDELNALCLLRDIDGRPAAVVEARIPRSITARGDMALRSAWISTFAAGVLLLGALYLLLQRGVVGPLTRFTQHALTLRPRAEVEAGLDLERRDEIGALSRRFAQLLGEVEDFQRKLADTSREAGMSEVATNVLHNVGNMLNSVSVSTSLVQERASKLPGPQLARVASLMRDKGAELGTWVTNDPAGRRLADGVSALERMLSDGQSALQRECGELAQRLGEVSELVRSQQSLAGKSGHIESVTLADEVEKALRLFDPAGKSITVERRCAKIAPVATERQKLLQVFVNLIKNAIEAFDGLERADKCIEISIAASAHSAQVTIRDNAVGIEPDKLTEIFQHGYTTKVGGHGFGLHSAANAMTELGGSIRAESDGPGRGACFIVELPLAGVRSVDSPAPLRRTSSAPTQAPVR